MNAFTDDMLETWLAALEQCRTSPEVRVIVITGTGRAFTTGGRRRVVRGQGLADRREHHERG